jgi:hypothetical protein
VHLWLVCPILLTGIYEINNLQICFLLTEGLLDELAQLLKGIAMMKELTPRAMDFLVSFGECMSTRIFAAYLNKIGAKARQVSKCSHLMKENNVMHGNPACFQFINTCFFIFVTLDASISSILVKYVFPWLQYMLNFTFRFCSLFN